MDKYMVTCHTLLMLPRYALVPRGQSPGVSVGHTCSFIPSDEEGKGKIVIVGGANPNGSFSESSVIDLGNVKTSHSELLYCVIMPVVHVRGGFIVLDLTSF